eukprot:TRINITY_DN428_c0_g2_i6.p1 TRINITY_DN428_c0_g2~~TRINITY_DN428_c0_g2_i6.p1  ORF type:complete len:391 (+),score=73.11 TRINITY_DN428_c0_g2_i6:45-1175(+)
MQILFQQKSVVMLLTSCVLFCGWGDLCGPKFSKMQAKVQKKFRVAIAEDTLFSVTNREMAETAAVHIFEKLAADGRDYFTKSSFATQLCMRRNHEIVKKGFEIFDGDGDGRVYLEDCIQEVVKIYKERNWLGNNLRDLENVTSMINIVLVIMMICILIFVWMIGYGFELLTMVIPMSSVILGFAFFFGSTGQRMLEGAILILGIRPYNVGDKIRIMDIAYQMTGVVKSIGMFSTYVETTKGEAIYIPNQLILSKGLFNFKRTKKVGIWFHMQISIDTPPEKIEDLRHRCKRFIDENKQIWDSSFLIMAEDIIDTNKVVLGCYFSCLSPWQDWVVWGPSKNVLLTFIISSLKELHIEYTLPTQHVRIENPSACDFRI